MPTLIQQHNCKVVIYHDDHPPPHVHIKLRDGREELLAEWQRINP